MRAFGVGTVGVMLAAAACGGGGDDGGDSPDASPPSARFDLDVVVESGIVAVWLRDLVDPVCLPEDHFARAGACELYGDGYECSAPYDPCARRVRLERDGAVLSDDRLYPGHMPASLSFDLQGEAVDLVIERCSESYRMTLPPPVTDAVIVTDITTDGDSYRGTVTTPAGTTGTHAEMRDGLGGRACHTASTERWTVGSDPAPGRLHVGAIRAHEPVATPWGVADVWTLARSPMTSDLVPLTELAPGRWRVGVPTPPTWSVWVDGEPFVDQRWQGLEWGLLVTPDGPLHQLTSGAYFVYEAGATTDRLRVLLTNGWHSADLPHVTPSNELAFSLADDGRFELAVGPVTLTNEFEPSLTRELAFTVAWDHAVIPRPVP